MIKRVACKIEVADWQQKVMVPWSPYGLLLTGGSRRCSSAGLMPTEARGNYLPEPPYLCETKTYHSQPLESIRHAGNYFVPLSIRPIFIFFVVAEVMSDYLTTDRLKKFSLLPEAPMMPEARGICHICHTVNPALRCRQCGLG